MASGRCVGHCPDGHTFLCKFSHFQIIIIIIIILLKFKFNTFLNLHNPHIASLIEAGCVTYNKIHYKYITLQIHYITNTLHYKYITL